MPSGVAKICPLGALRGLCFFMRGAQVFLCPFVLQHDFFCGTHTPSPTPQLCPCEHGLWADMNTGSSEALPQLFLRGRVIQMTNMHSELRETGYEKPSDPDFV